MGPGYSVQNTRMLISAVKTEEPNMLRGSFAVGTGTRSFTRHGQIVQFDQQPA